VDDALNHKVLKTMIFSISAATARARHAQ